MSFARCVWLLMTAWLCGCDVPIDHGSCKLGVERVVAQVWAKDFDAIELSSSGEQLIALWSEPNGLFARRLDDKARAIADVRRLGPRCKGGLASAPDGDATEVACLVPTERGEDEDSGGLFVLRISRDLRLERSLRLGSAGALSENVVMARGKHGIEVAWQDASPDAHRIVMARLNDAGASALVLSEPDHVASAPSMASFGGSTAITWAENWVIGEKLNTSVLYLRGAGRPRSVLPSAPLASTPLLFALSGEPVLGYRDRSAAREKTGLYLMRLGLNGQRMHEPERIGRADGIGKPALFACMGGVVAATPRTYAGEYFVGVNWLDVDLKRGRGEQQFYENSRAFTQVSGLCIGTTAVLLIAEFPALDRDTTALRAVTYSCR